MDFRVAHNFDEVVLEGDGYQLDPQQDGLLYHFQVRGYLIIGGRGGVILSCYREGRGYLIIVVIFFSGDLSG